MKRFLKRLFLFLFCLAVILGGIGFYIGNMAYEEFYDAPWDQLLGIENHSRDVSTVRQWEKERGWEPVRVNGQDGTILRGTYIENRHDSHKTVILIHGLYQNRSMCLPYMEVYRRMGYNILLIDLRGHGESEGEHTEWGMREIDDLAMWCQWLRNRDEQMHIGLHGVSLGAAMSLLYAGSEYGKDLSFVVADSSYGNVIDMGVGVVIGGAFGKITNSVVNDIIMPLISMLTGGVDFSAWKWVLKEAVMEGSKVVTPEVAVNYGNLIAVILDFIIIAFAVFCMVKAINKMHDKLSKPAEPEPEKAPEPTKEEVLLAEIRDLLKEQSK